VNKGERDQDAAPEEQDEKRLEDLDTSEEEAADVKGGRRMWGVPAEEK
jgi:hypothetical protein